jgi:hypothetical protein
MLVSEYYTASGLYYYVSINATISIHNSVYYFTFYHTKITLLSPENLVLQGIRITVPPTRDTCTEYYNDVTSGSAQSSHFGLSVREHSRAHGSYARCRARYSRSTACILNGIAAVVVAFASLLRPE